MFAVQACPLADTTYAHCTLWSQHVSPGTSFSTYLGTDPAVKVKYFSHAEERGGRGWLTRSRQLVHRAFTDIRNARKVRGAGVCECVRESV